MNTEKSGYIITFSSPNQSNKLYYLLKKHQLDITMIQLPCHLSAGCARAIVIKEDDLYKAIDLIKNDDFDGVSIYQKVPDPQTRRHHFEEIQY